MTRIIFAGRLAPIIGTFNWKCYSSDPIRNIPSEILEQKIIHHLYTASVTAAQDSLLTNFSINQGVQCNVPLSPVNIFYKCLDAIRPHNSFKKQDMTFLAETCLSQLSSASLSAAGRDLLLVSAALATRGSSSALEPAILSGLSAGQDTAATLRLLYVAGLVRLRLPAALWRSVQRRLSDPAAVLSEADLVALGSSSFRCGAAITRSRLQQRLLAAARRLADEERHTGSLIALLKALRLARVSFTSSPLLASLRGLVLRRGAHLPLPAAAHLAACWCSPPVSDAPLLAVLESTLRRRLETLPERPSDVSTSPSDVSTSPPDVSTLPPDVSTSPSDVSTSPPDVSILLPGFRRPTPDVSTAPSVAAVPDGRPKDVARLLYVFSHLYHVPERATLDLTERCVAGWSFRRPLPLVDALLSMAILGHYPQPLLEKVLTQHVAERLAAAGRSRQLSRLALLRVAVALETPLRPPSLDRLLAPAALPAPSLERELRRRPLLAPLLERLRRQQPAAHAALGYPVPHLNSASVLLAWPDGRRAAVELLDRHVLLVRNDDVTNYGNGTQLGALDVTDAGHGDDTDHSGFKGYQEDTGRCGASDHGDVTKPGPHLAVGLIRLKARLAEKMGYRVWWELRS